MSCSTVDMDLTTYDVKVHTYCSIIHVYRHVVDYQVLGLEFKASTFFFFVCRYICDSKTLLLAL